MTCSKGNLPKRVDREYARLKFFVHYGILADEPIRNLKKEGYGNNKREISKNLRLQMNNADKRVFRSYYEKLSLDCNFYLGFNGGAISKEAKEREDKIREALMEERHYSRDFFNAHIRQQDSIDWYDRRYGIYNNERRLHSDLNKIRDYYFNRALGLKPRLPKRLISLSKNCDICNGYSKVACKSMNIYRKGVLLNL